MTNAGGREEFGVWNQEISKGDPACGTGGFLVSAIEHLRKQAKTEADERIIQECFSGIEKKHLLTQEVWYYEHQAGNQDALIEGREQIDPADQAQVDDRPGVGDDDHEDLPSSRSISDSS